MKWLAPDSNVCRDLARRMTPGMDTVATNRAVWMPDFCGGVCEASNGRTPVRFEIRNATERGALT
jgi:hypothetical protein